MCLSHNVEFKPVVMKLHRMQRMDSISFPLNNTLFKMGTSLDRLLS